MPSLRAKVTVRARGQSDVINYLNRVHGKLRDPRGGLERMTREVGRYWTLNFQSEGGLASSWANLAQRTVEDRVALGFPGEHPIMQRAKGLYQVAGLMVQNARQGSSSFSTPYDNRAGHSMRGRVEFNKSSVMLTAEGPQVFNNWPGRRTVRPARPFWPTNRAVVGRAQQGVWTWLLDEVLT